MIRVGMGGWTFEPWRGVFYPPGLPAKRELEYASRHVTAIEVNGTFYRTQKPDTFRKWADETPDDFVFALKAPAAVVNRRVLAETEGGIARFVESGIAELGSKLGPILWQLAPTKAFDADDIGAFLKLLPRGVDGRDLGHALEVRHPSFVTPGFVALARDYGVTIVFADSAVHPAIADLTGPCVYLRLQHGSDDEPTCYPPSDLNKWAERAKLWAVGGEPQDLPRISDATAPAAAARPVYVFFINKGKVRAPAAAEALIARL